MTRGAALRRRRLDRLASWVLAVLVAVSVGLSAVLWLSTPPLPAPLVASPGTAYRAPDALPALPPQRLIEPARLDLLYPGGPDVALGDPAASPLFALLWADVRAVFARLGPQALRAARPVGEAAVAAALARQGAGLEVDFGPTLTWSEWYAAFGGAASGWPVAAEAPVDRAYLVPGPASTAVYLLCGEAGYAAAVPGSAGSDLRALLFSQEGQAPRGGYPLVPLGPVPRLPFAVSQDVLVPPHPSWGPVAAGPEPLSALRLAGAVFPDPLSVREARAGRGAVAFTDPSHAVLTVRPAAGEADLAEPAPAPAAVAAPDWWTALGWAGAFVGRAGGWPPSAWLADVETAYAPGACALASCAARGYTFAFATRFDGLPVFGATPALLVRLDGALVVAYGRRVPVPRGPWPGRARPWLGARAALEALAAHLPLAPEGAPLVADEVFPAWAAIPGRLEPAWAIHLVPTAGGVAYLALVDAITGRLRYLVPER